MATNAFGGVEITSAVKEANFQVTNLNTTGDQKIAAATLLVLLDIRRVLERIERLLEKEDG